VRACIIFNPAAKGQKAERFRRSLGIIAAECDLKFTAAPGDARRFATAAVQAGFETVIAAGGDGTLNEVLNGIGDAPGGFARTRLGVLPLGTINVFARELNIPTQPEAAWQILRRGKEMTVDLPRVEYTHEGKQQLVYFAQLAGAGLDARAIQLVSWSLKKRIGSLAYVVAGVKALREHPPVFSISDGVSQFSGQLVLAGNGRLYGGSFDVFPQAALTDGLIEVCIFPCVSWPVLIRCGITLLLSGRLPENVVTRLRAKSFELSGASTVWTEVDGELAGPLPARFSVLPATLRVLVP
jgi:diacylglycerol kinase (ATP)